MALLAHLPRWFRAPLLPCLGLALALQGAPALAAQPMMEQQVKAAYLYKFAGFIEWPEGSFARPDSALVIGVAGNDALAEQLERLVAGHKADGHALEVRRVAPGQSLEGLHILFVGSIERAATAELLGAARGKSLLTVSDSELAHTLGTMVNFVVIEDRLRFEVALRHVAPSRLRISARMLAAARKVQPGDAS
ncbi:MAG: YfiR family protein [Pseudomonadota bacterium]